MTLFLAESANDAAYMLSQSAITSTRTIGGLTIYTATYNGNSYMLAVYGYGKINLEIAIKTALNISLDIDNIIGIGTAGYIGLRCPCDTEIASAIIATGAYQYDVDMTEFGAPYSTFVDMATGFFDADTTITSALTASAANLSIPYKVGTIATADRFTSDDTISCMLYKNDNAIAVDMMTGSIGHGAYLEGIPYGAIKGISNYGGDCAVYEDKAYHQAATLTAQKIALRYLTNNV